LKIEWTDNDVDIEKLAGPPTFFQCPGPEQTDYFLKSAWDHQNQGIAVTYVLLLKRDLIGYVTVTMDEIPLAKLERPEGIPFSRLPAMKIAQLGVHSDLNGNGFGQYLVTYAMSVALELKQKVGCRYVTLDAKADLVEWYEEQGFVRNEKDQEEKVAAIENTPGLKPAKREARLAELPISMRFDLHCFGS
jgi:predicted GNAT family N-acyltransferase